MTDGREVGLIYETELMKPGLDFPVSRHDVGRVYQNVKRFISNLVLRATGQSLN